ncbi:MAG: ABC transporter permease, partial [Bacillota bacterium]
MRNSKLRDLMWGAGNLALVASRPLVAILAAFLVSAGLILAVGANPIEGYAALYRGSVGSLSSWAVTAVRMTPLLLAGLGIGIGFKAGVFNVGAEGQIYAGAALATTFALIPLPVPSFMHITLCLLAGFVGGALWALLPGYLLAYRGISEVVITLMMNYVGIYLNSYLVHGPLAEVGACYPQSPLIQQTARLPILMKGTSMHAGILI